MKYLITICQSSLVFMSFVVVTAGINSVSASTIQGAANNCFPRVFSQIDQFKSSSGGLRNENANPRTIVCSPDNDTYGEDEESAIFTGLIHVEELPADMECTSYMRSIYDGSLIDVHTEIFPAGSVGDLNLFDNDVVDFPGLENPGDVYEVYTYIQCKVPGNGRIFGVETIWGLGFIID